MEKLEVASLPGGGGLLLRRHLLYIRTSKIEATYNNNNDNNNNDNNSIIGITTILDSDDIVLKYSAAPWADPSGWPRKTPGTAGAAPA